MNNYELREGTTHCHLFINSNSYIELLEAILKWWEPKEKEDGVCIVAINFHIDDEYNFNCAVYWVSPPPGFDMLQELENQRAKERANPFDLPEL